MLAITTSIIAGLVVLIVQYMLNWRVHHQIYKFESRGIENILSDRKNTPIYKEIISSAKQNVYVMGTSCARFIEDFADNESSDHVLIDRMDKHNSLEFHLLIPQIEYMDGASKNKLAAVGKKITALKSKFGRRFKIRRYGFEPRHSMVIADDNLIAGPVFQEVESKHSPAIHLRISKSKFADKYLDYYKDVWENRSVPFK